MVEEALRDDLGVTLVIAAQNLLQHHGKGILKLAETKRIKIFWISERLMDFLSESKTPQPVMAVAKMKEHSESELINQAAGLIIVAHQLQDPGNLGTIIRTAEAVNASGIAITRNTVDPLNPKVIRASMGSILRVPIVSIPDISRFISSCKQNGFQTIATDVIAKQTHFDLDLKRKTLVILGQEGSGLPGDLMDLVDVQIKIPMAGTIDSLNVATAATVILYEAFRQRISM